MTRPTHFTLREFSAFLRERRYGPAGLMAILDPVRWGNLEEDLLLASNQWTLLYRGKEVKEYFKVMPYAVSIRKIDGFYPQLERRLGQECCIIAETDLTSPDSSKIISHLMGLPYCITPEGKNGFFRYYDPSILAAFLSCADGEQLARLFGPYISAFWFEDGYAGTVSCRARPSDLPAPPSGPFRISPEQFEILQEAQYAKYAQAVENEIRQEFYPSERSLSPELSQRIRTALEIAEQYAYLSRTEGYEFVRASARFGWNFHEHAEFQKLLADDRLSPLEKLEALDASGGS